MAFLNIKDDGSEILRMMFLNIKDDGSPSYIPCYFARFGVSYVGCSTTRTRIHDAKSCVTTNAALLLNWQFCQQSPKQNGSTKGAQTCEQRWRETVPCKAT